MLRGLGRLLRATGHAFGARRRLEHLAVDRVDAVFHAVDARELRLHAVRDIDNRLRDALVRLRRLLRARRELFGRRRDLVGRVRDVLDELPEVLRHRVKRMREVAELIARVDGDFRAQVAIREQRGLVFQDGDRLRDAARKQLADDHDDDEADERHDDERDFHVRELGVDDALRHGHHHDPARAVDCRIGDNRIFAVHVLREHAGAFRHHLGEFVAEARDVLGILVLELRVFRRDDLAVRREDRAHARALVIELFDVAVEAFERNIFADRAAERAVLLVIRHSDGHAELVRDLVDVRIGVERLALRLRVLVPAAFLRDELAREVAGRVADDAPVLAADREAQEHLILRRCNLVDRRNAHGIIKRAHVRGSVLGHARVRRDPSDDILPLALDVRRDSSPGCSC